MKPLLSFHIPLLSNFPIAVKMPPKRTSTSAAPAMTQAAIQQLVADSVVAATGMHQLATMASTTIQKENWTQEKLLVARKCTYND
ncbi:hypothetical protein Tco_0365968 [Tanacetum coccineum]